MLHRMMWIFNLILMVATSGGFQCAWRRILPGRGYKYLRQNPHGGSRKEARKKIYLVSTKYIFFFVCNVPLEIADKIIDSKLVVFVNPLSDSDMGRTDFWETGEPFIDGQALPYDPKYHVAMVEYYFRSSFSVYERPSHKKRPCRASPVSAAHASRRILNGTNCASGIPTKA